VHAVQTLNANKDGGTNLKVEVPIIFEQSKQKLNCCTQNCHINFNK